MKLILVLSLLAALVAGVGSFFGRRKKDVRIGKRTVTLDSAPETSPRNKIARPKRAKYQRILRVKFAVKNLERHGFEFRKGVAVRPNEKTRRIFRNARKLERQQAA